MLATKGNFLLILIITYLSYIDSLIGKIVGPTSNTKIDTPTY